MTRSALPSLLAAVLGLALPAGAGDDQPALTPPPAEAVDLYWGLLARPDADHLVRSYRAKCVPLLTRYATTYGPEPVRFTGAVSPWELVHACILSLADLGPDAPVETLRGLLQYPTHRGTVLSAVGRTRRPECVADVLPYLTDPVHGEAAAASAGSAGHARGTSRPAADG